MPTSKTKISIGAAAAVLAAGAVAFTAVQAAPAPAIAANVSANAAAPIDPGMALDDAGLADVPYPWGKMNTYDGNKPQLPCWERSRPYGHEVNMAAWGSAHDNTQMSWNTGMEIVKFATADKAAEAEKLWIGDMGTCMARFPKNDPSVGTYFTQLRQTGEVGGSTTWAWKEGNNYDSRGYETPYQATVVRQGTVVYLLKYMDWGSSGPAITFKKEVPAIKDRISKYYPS
ncbi:hypothetical protein J4573_39135 [Actinomadura barringtoniae]|uniref:Serine/threonine protein kinase n=1 Tax=Actinomadura barringtoniae TaxID=1427535 RepID=A0A939PHU7_9ACTN|nr:hypothetical protein [Actinomadura barringtoniae]MBO2453162.1 hypothetical protein [Actinomadura barringtoniae]